MLTLSNRSLLNKTFIADGAFSLLVGAILIVDAAPLAVLISPAATPLMMKLLGVGLFAWAFSISPPPATAGLYRLLPVSASAATSCGR